MATEINPRPLRCELMFAALMLRLWVGMRLLFAGLDKFRVKGETIFSMDAYEGNVQAIADAQARWSPIPQQMADIYAFVLGYLLIAVGFLVVIGLFTRLSLLAAGLLLVSLAAGLMLLPDDGEAVLVGIQVAITAFALSLWWHDRISLDGILFRRGKRSKKDQGVVEADKAPTAA